MVSLENKIILGFGALALLLVVVGAQFAWWNTWLLLAVVIVVGVLFPLAIVDGLDGDD